MSYEVEVLSEYDDNGTMVDNVDTLREAVVGHRIVSAEKKMFHTERWGSPFSWEQFVITLDDGTEVALADGGDCCAYTELDSFLLNADKVDHIITGVGTTGEYSTWHIYADLGDVLQLNVGWSCGNPFYYGYGFNITVKGVDQ